ncbi:MAG TPA: DUF2177 family protein [Methylibium sp.]|uniref:DUF2177 family protein n=1 Tax=Methylibium sp. TaxID=2067992 RepID=UPI002DBC53B8|nr:DUF2177 family protein [Methylibium sp.]HEU4460495.1 DUF2177 family protein [Methylibium sp.]
MRVWIVAYLAAAAVMLVLDVVWLTSAIGFYRERIGHLMADNVRLDGAIAFYLFYLAGVVYFAVRPALAEGSSRRAAQHGAVFGFMAYMTYDLTNLATLRGFPVSVVLADLAWGTLLTTVVALSSYAAARRAGR